MFKTIVVATDGSAHGSRALDVAGQIARDGAHRVVIVHVTELVGGKGGVVPLAADEDDLRAALESNANELQADGIAAEVVTPIVRLGGPAHAIVEVADSVKADVIIVGRRGHSLWSEVLLGGVPIRLMQIARCPVLVVPTVTDDAE